jgi:putative oxidoreductase
MSLGVTVVRIIVGVLFMGHGLQKLAGWFGGGGHKATAEAFESMGLKPGEVNATAAGLSETVGGGLLALGALTPVGCALVTGTMAVAIDTVHGPNGLWAANNGYEYNLVLTTIAFGIAARGPGPFSVDERPGLNVSGPAVAVGELALGLAGAAAIKRTMAGSAQAA